jgi:hypothetical protein
LKIWKKVYINIVRLTRENGRNRWQIANFTNSPARSEFFTPKAAFWKAWMEHKVITDQIKEEKNWKNWIGVVSFEYREREGNDLPETWENLKFECFPANPSQILPTFCHGTKVKPLKIWEKKTTKFIVRLTGRKEEKSCFAKK